MVSKTLSESRLEMQGLTGATEYGKEHMQLLTGMDDKGIEGKVTEMVKASS